QQILRPDQRLQAAVPTARASRSRGIDVEMTEVAGTPSGAGENLAIDDEAAADAAPPTEVGRYGIRPQSQLNPNGMQGRQLTVIGYADMNAVDSQVSQSGAHPCAEREVLP